MEKWIDIPGFKGGYQVSNHGRVRSLDREIHSADGRVYRAKGRVLLTPTNPGGYPSCRLGRGNAVMVHQLVALAFLGPANGRYACHNDGNKNNNCVDNIRYDSPKGNQADRIEHGTDRRGSQLPYAKLDEGQIEIIRALKGVLTQQQLAEQFGVCRATISFVQNRKTWVHVA